MEIRFSEHLRVFYYADEGAYPNVRDPEDRQPVTNPDRMKELLISGLSGRVPGSFLISSSAWGTRGRILPLNGLGFGSYGGQSFPIDDDCLVSVEELKEAGWTVDFRPGSPERHSRTYLISPAGPYPNQQTVSCWDRIADIAAS